MDQKLLGLQNGYDVRIAKLEMELKLAQETLRQVIERVEAICKVIVGTSEDKNTNTALSRPIVLRVVEVVAPLQSSGAVKPQ